MAIKIQGTTVIDDSRNGTNFSSVGIGTTSASASFKLDIGGTTGGASGTFRSGGFWVDSSGICSWGGGASTAAYGILTWDTGYASIYGTTGNELRLGSGGTQNRVTINTSGDVGINSTSPGQKLDVVGSIRASSQLISTVATGTAPLSVSSTTGVTNLNADLLDGIHAVNLYNNMGEVHGTRTSFDASSPSYDFGYRYVQGSTNGPGTSGTQFYSWYIGLGSQYASTGAGSYGAMFAIDRNVTTPYLSVRYNENNAFTSWRKVASGYADSAGGLSGYSGTYWTSANDGSGSGLDADLLDGNNSSYFAPAASIQTLGTGVNYNTDRTVKVTDGIAVYAAYNSGTGSPTTYDTALQVIIAGSRGFEIVADWIGTGSTPLYVRSLRDCCQNWSTFSQIWTSTTDGSGSGLDADLLDGSGWTSGQTVSFGSATFTTSNDNQIELNSGGSSWAGIRFVDVGGNDYLWYNGQYSTFSIGGGGANVSGKKLHVDGGMTVGVNYDNTAPGTNGLNVEGDIKTAGYYRRNAAATGFLNGGYSGVETSSTTGAIYAIGDSYVPTSSSLNTMYGIGYTYAPNTSGLTGFAGGWGMYVASNGTARIYLESDTGIGQAANDWRAPLFYDSSNTGYYLNGNTTSAWRIGTPSGYLDIGPMNSSFCHFNTDRAQYYFEKDIHIDAAIVDYDNTACYVDPASTSVLNKVHFGAGTGRGFAEGYGTYSSRLGRIAYISFDWDANYDAYSNHGIASTDSSGTFSDNISINSYNDITLRVDSNDNNSASYVRFMNNVTGSNQYAYIGYSGSAYVTYFEGSLGVNTPPSGTNGEIRATNNITAYYSDKRLKNFVGTIDNALAKLMKLNGYYFFENEVAKSLGYNNDDRQVGVSAQEVEEVLPEVVTEAPISSNFPGTDYKTVRYEKMIPLLIEAIKEQQKQIEELKAIINSKLTN